MLKKMYAAYGTNNDGELTGCSMFADYNGAINFVRGVMSDLIFGNEDTIPETCYKGKENILEWARTNAGYEEKLESGPDYISYCGWSYAIEPVYIDDQEFLEAESVDEELTIVGGNNSTNRIMGAFDKDIMIEWRTNNPANGFLNIHVLKANHDNDSWESFTWFKTKMPEATRQDVLVDALRMLVDVYKKVLHLENSEKVSRLDNFYFWLTPKWFIEPAGFFLRGEHMDP